MSTREWTGIAVGLVVAAVLVAFVVGRGGSGTHSRPPAPDAVSPVPDAEPARVRPGDAPGPALGASSQPLPPVGTPLRLSIGELQRRARAGEPDAMCRLAAELTECNRIRGMLDATGRTLDVAASGRYEDGLDPAVRAQWHADITKRAGQLIEQSRHCDGVPEVEQRELLRQWRAAARAGNLPAMEYYASGQAIPRDEILSLLPELAAYRTEAPPMARRLLETGSPQWALTLGMAYQPDARSMSLLAQAVDPDPVEALALLRLARGRWAASGGSRQFDRMIGSQIVALESELAPEDRDAAARRMAELDANVRHRDPPPWEQHIGREHLVEGCAAAVRGG